MTVFHLLYPFGMATKNKGGSRGGCLTSTVTRRKTRPTKTGARFPDCRDVKYPFGGRSVATDKNEGIVHQPLLASPQNRPSTPLSTPRWHKASCRAGETSSRMPGNAAHCALVTVGPVSPGQQWDTTCKRRHTPQPSQGMERHGGGQAAIVSCGTNTSLSRNSATAPQNPPHCQFVWAMWLLGLLGV